MSCNLAYTVVYSLEKKGGGLFEESKSYELQDVRGHLPNISEMKETEVISWLEKNSELETHRLKPIFNDDAHLYKACTVKFISLLLVERGAFVHSRELMKEQDL